MKVHVGEMVVEVESDRDIELLQKLISSRQSRLNNGHVNAEERRETIEVQSVPLPQQELGTFQRTIETWFEHLRSEAQKRLIGKLATESRWFKDQELCDTLGFRKIGQLSGVLCGITRHAKAVKLKPTDVVQKRMERTPEGVREHSYRLNPKTQPVVVRIIGESP